MLDSLGLTSTSTVFPTAFQASSTCTGTAHHRVHRRQQRLNAAGFFPLIDDAAAEYLDSGGRLWALGQNWALTEDSGSFHSRLDRGRMYSGYLGLAFENDNAYATGRLAEPAVGSGRSPE